MQNLLEKIYNDKNYILIVNDILTNETVLQMKSFKQHCDISCFEHCLYASYYSYLICKKMHLDYISAARAGMLHDLFLYDWRYRLNGRKGLHAFTHPRTALENSIKIFDINKKEQDIILKHMWPITIIPPKYIESYILTIVDKHCAIKETLNYIQDTCSKKKAFKYAYVFLSLLILRF